MPTPNEQRDEQAFRRCHACGHMCEAPKQIQMCSQCAKPFAPFFYYDDHIQPVYLDLGLRPTPIEGEWAGIQGLTAYWRVD